MAPQPHRGLHAASASSCTCGRGAAKMSTYRLQPLTFLSRALRSPKHRQPRNISACVRLMAETAATIVFFFPATPSVAKLPFCPSPSRLFSSAASAAPSSSSSSSSPQSRTVVRSSPRDSGGGDFIGNNPFSFFPWDSNPHRDAIEWVQEERVTLFTADGLIQIGGSIVPREASSLDKQQGRGKPSQKFKRFQEQDYMDPNQGLCLGALFDIAATNGLDMGRRLCIFGFCRSIEMLSDVVEDAVLEHGGEVVAAEKASDGGLQEKLTMTVAVPLLWGVPPASETLHFAVRNGGGIVDKIYWQWDFL